MKQQQQTKIKNT